MAFVKLSVLAILLLAAYVSAEPPMSNDLTTDTSALATSISSVLVDWVGKLVEYFFDFVDLKMRSIRFLVTLYTDENLHLLKRYMTIGLSLFQWLFNLIPESTSEVSLKFLSYLFPQQNLPEEETKNVDDLPKEPLLHNLGREDRSKPLSNEEDFMVPSESKRVATAISPFADQIRSLDNLINARSENFNIRK